MCCGEIAIGEANGGTGMAGVRCYIRIFILSDLIKPCVCNQLLINCYMWPEGPWQRLAAALADSSGVLPDHILSQIEMIDPSRAPLSPAPKNRRTKEKVK